MAPYGNPLGPSGIAHEGMLPPPPAGSSALASGGGVGPDMTLHAAMQQGMAQQPGYQLESRNSANSDAAVGAGYGNSASEFGDRSVVIQLQQCVPDVCDLSCIQHT